MNTAFSLGVRGGKSGLLTYGITPPKAATGTDKVVSITQKRLERLSQVSIDGLILYDLQDESSRLDGERPFPFLPTIHPLDYLKHYLGGLEVEPILYQAVGNYSKVQLQEVLAQLKSQALTMVGAPSREYEPKTSLSQAYEIAGAFPDLLLGGVCIAERHGHGRSEHTRMIRKQQSGVQYFVSQCVYDVQQIKNLMSDYYYGCRSQGLAPAPVMFTVTPCGSVKTMEFIRWLGVSVPHWIENEMKYGAEPLAYSIDASLRFVDEMADFCLDHTLPFGVNVESVSIVREEVLASFELTTKVHELLAAKGLR